MIQWPSENIAPSSPTSTEHHIFSSESVQPTSPPSSPPDFQWKEDRCNKLVHDSPKHRSKSLLSVLGKRKALDDLDNNVQPVKKRAASLPHVPDHIERAGGKKLTQTQLSLGQQTQKKCTKCGMEYVPSSEEDRALHQQHHDNVTKGYHLGKSFKPQDWTCFDTEHGNDVIIAVDHLCPVQQRRRAKEVLEIVEKELGAVAILGDDLWSSLSVGACQQGKFVNYLYVRQGRCIGYVLVERIKRARQVLAPTETTTQDKRSQKENRQTTASIGTSAVAALKARRQAFAEALSSNQPIQLSTKCVPASLGIARIWTLPSCRGQDIASILLNTATSHLALRPLSGESEAAMQGTVSRSYPSNTRYRKLSASERTKLVAFSQPTEAGTRLARKWFRRLSGWMVYVV